MSILTQTALVQSQEASPGSLPLTTSHTVPRPILPSAYHVLVRVLAVALNPNDYKMVVHFPMIGNAVGCDFCGIVEAVGTGVIQHDLHPSQITHPIGTRVCGATFPYKPDGDSHNGSFSEYVAADSRLLLKVPQDWSDLQGAALGGVGWSTVCLALTPPDALALQGFPSKPIDKSMPVLVYGGSTATGTLACQLLSL